jgi:hypothetical protein
MVPGTTISHFILTAHQFKYTLTSLSPLCPRLRQYILLGSVRGTDASYSPRHFLPSVHPLSYCDVAPRRRRCCLLHVLALFHVSSVSSSTRRCSDGVRSLYEHLSSSAPTLQYHRALLLRTRDVDTSPAVSNEEREMVSRSFVTNDIFSTHSATCSVSTTWPMCSSSFPFENATASLRGITPQDGKRVWSAQWGDAILFTFQSTPAVTTYIKPSLVMEGIMNRVRHSRDT